MEPITTVEHEGHTIEIFYDPDSESPRGWGTATTFWTFHPRYCSPDPNPNRDFKPNDREHIWLPVWIYDHSEVIYEAAVVNPFSCPWDSGCVGLIWVSKEDIRRLFGWKHLTKTRALQVVEWLKAEVREYSRWANGEVYGFEIPDTGESCWGFYDLGDCIEEAKACV